MSVCLQSLSTKQVFLYILNYFANMPLWRHCFSRLVKLHHWVWGFHFFKAKTSFCMFILLAAGQCYTLCRMQLFGGFFNLRAPCTWQTVLEERSWLYAVLRGLATLSHRHGSCKADVPDDSLYCVCCSLIPDPLCGLRWVTHCFPDTALWIWC